MALFQEFKDFALKGNVVDMAVGVIIGVAFGKIVSSLVADVIMPPLGLLIGGVDFSSLQFVLKGSGSDKVAINYGSFLNAVIDFLIIALSIFFLVKLVNKLLKTKKESPNTKECPECCMAIPKLAKRCCHCGCHQTV